MNTDPAGPLAGLSWGTLGGAFMALMTPFGLAYAWAFRQGRDGSQLTISGQASLLKTLQENVDSLTDRIEKLSAHLDERDKEARSMGERIHRLEMQIVQLGATPVA